MKVALHVAAAGGPHKDQPVYAAGAPLEQARAVMVLLHGRGAGASDIMTVAEALQAPATAYLAPEAGGHTWYPYRFTAPLADNEPWLSSALAAVGDILAWVQAAGKGVERTVVLGFSQGACLALEYTARNPARYGGVAGLSGGLIGPDDERGIVAGGESALAGVPVFLGCSDVDPHIPRPRVEATAAVFQGMGAEVSLRIYPSMGHEVNVDELRHVREMLERITSA